MAGGSLPDGGFFVMDANCQPLPSQCTWTFVRCESASECAQPGWGCLVVPGQTTIKTCFPDAVACSATQACPSAWSCIDFTQVHDDDPLEIWQATGSNYCWPDVLKGALSDEIRTDSSGLGLSGTGGGVAPPTRIFDAGYVVAPDLPGTTIDAGAAVTPELPGTTIDAGAAVTPTEGTPATPVSRGSKSGCSIAGQGAVATPWALLALVLGLLRLGRRRE